MLAAVSRYCQSLVAVAIVLGAGLATVQAHDLERLMDRVPEIGKRIRDIGHARAPHRVEPHPSDQGRTRKPAREPPAKPGA